MDVANSISQLPINPPGAGFKGDWYETSPTEPRGDASGLCYVALQPIFNSRRHIVAYEALSRSGWGNQFEGNSNEATRRMVDDCVSHGLSGLTGGLPVFLNCTRESLVSGVLSRLPRSTVLELLETIVPDSEVLQACRELKQLGFRIALDDFRPGDGMAEIMELADFIKVDFRLSDRTERQEIRRLMKHSYAALVAEKIETLEEFQEACDEAFTLFQGYFLARPAVFSKPDIRVAA